MRIDRWTLMRFSGLWMFFAAALAAGPAAAENKTIGVSLPEAQNPFYVAMGKAIEARLADRGYKAIVLSADANVNEQISNLNDLIAAAVALIIMSPLNLEGPAPAVKAAKDAGIPVVMIARKLDDKYKDLWEAFVGFNIEKVGRLKGQWVVDNLKPGPVAMLLGPEGALFAIEQERGFREIVEPAGFKVAFTRNSVQTRENGVKLAEDALIAVPGLKAIYASNDDLALGAAQAVKAAGMGGKVAVLGTNGIPPAIAAIHRGDMAMTVQLDPVRWGQLGADIGVDFVEGRKPDSDFIEFQSEPVSQAEACGAMPPPLRERFGMPAKC